MTTKTAFPPFNQSLAIEKDDKVVTLTITTPLDQNQTESIQNKMQKVHFSTVCMVPPDSAVDVWEQLTKARRQLRDPGLYRWPPHANLLYPFVNLCKPKKNKQDSFEAAQQGSPAEMDSEYDEEIFAECMNRLVEAVQQIEPFDITLEELGTFGGKKRGVLWMYPTSKWVSPFYFANHVAQSRSTENEPLIRLQGLLQEALPLCNDQQKGGRYAPHITLTHTKTLEEAESLKSDIMEWWKPVKFRCEEIYVLQRKGDDGQFQIVATIRLGKLAAENGASIERSEKPRAFVGMPQVEEDWVREERMKLKKRRNRGGRGRRSRRRSRSKEEGATS